jgi:uncharacterized protein (TIGR02145 family)
MTKHFTLLVFIFACISNAQTVNISSSATGAVCAGTSVTFTATTSGITSPTYQWYKNGTAISGETNATYTTTSLSNNDQIKVICNNPPSIVNDNSLQLWLDAGNSASYSSGTTWRDLSGNGRNATLNSGASFDATSKSIVTNGVDQYVSVPLFNSSITNTTMQTWVYINANSKGAFISNGTSSYSIGIGSSVSGEMSNNGNRAWMLFSSVRYIDTNTDYPSGWHLVTMTMDANAKPSYYLDGSFVYTSPSGSNPNIVSDSFNLGAVPGDGGKYYNGKFAAAYFYNRVLTASEISQNYNATVGTVGGASVSGIISNIISTSISTVPSASITVAGDACMNKTTLSTTTGLSSYTWYKDNVSLSGATTNTYVPTIAGDYKVTVSNGTCSSTSSVTAIYTCGVTADGKMGVFGTSIVLVNKEGAINGGGGIDERGLILNIPGTVVIGNQRWKDTNLDVTTYRNGDSITFAADATAWNNATNAGTGVWCYYNFDPANNALYGKLYNWHAVNDSRGLAPLGYHIPTETEWDTFISYLGGNPGAGGKIKTTGTSLWASPNTGATNSSGFNGLPGGYTFSGGFYGTATAVGFWWSASQYSSSRAWTYNVSKDDSNIRKSDNDKNFGFSVRLIKD